MNGVEWKAKADRYAADEALTGGSGAGSEQPLREIFRRPQAVSLANGLGRPGADGPPLDAGACQARSSASSMSSTVAAGATKPDSIVVDQLRRAADVRDDRGRPHSIASIIASGLPSNRDGSTKA